MILPRSFILLITGFRFAIIIIFVMVIITIINIILTITIISMAIANTTIIINPNFQFVSCRYINYCY